MTREKAIRHFERYVNDDCYTIEHQESCRMAVAALREQEERENNEPTTNADSIRSMNDEELAWELMTWRCEAVAKHHGVESKYPDTQKTILSWLKKPPKEDA